MSDKGVAVRAVTYRHEAELVVLSLVSAGIEAWLVDQFLVSSDPFISNAIGGIKIHVDERDEARARSALAELDEPVRAGDGCLSCGAPMNEAEQRCSACGWSYLVGG